MLPQKRFRDSLNSLENIEIAYKKKHPVTKTPREALADIMAVRLTQGQLVIGRVGTFSKLATRKKSPTIKITSQVKLAFPSPLSQDADKENQQPPS